MYASIGQPVGVDHKDLENLLRDQLSLTIDGADDRPEARGRRRQVPEAACCDGGIGEFQVGHGLHIHPWEPLVEPGTNGPMDVADFDTCVRRVRDPSRT